MTSPEPTPERIDELLAGSEPRDGAEREALALMQDIRGIEDEPSLSLQTRIEQIGAAPPDSPQRWHERIPGIAGGLFTTPRLAIAGGVAVLALLAVVALPLGDGSTSADDTLAEAPVGQVIEREDRGVAADDAFAAPEANDAPGDAAAAIAPPGAEPAPDREKSVVPADAIAPGPDPGRPQDVRVETVVQTDGVTGLSKASATAMKQIRALGGFTVSSQYSVPGSESGVNQLLFKVPAGRVEEALEGFSELGAITSQQASLVDLGDQLSASQVQITQRRERVRALREDLKKNPDDATLAAQLKSAENGLAQFIERRRKIQERARLATINLTLTTDGPTVVTKGQENRFIAAFNRSADRFGVVLEWLISAAVFLLPIGFLGWLGVRLAHTARRRNARRVMDMV